MKRILEILRRFLIFSFLTLLTQVGGVIYLLNIFTYKFIDARFEKRIYRIGLRVASFLVAYSIATFLIVPLLAKPFGRVPLPFFETKDLQPLNVWTCLLNRHYVKPELKEIAFSVAEEMNKKFPGTTINYLDANFPFINEFPLLPHLSHDDGKKLDLAFCYRDRARGKETNEAPSFIGYGICEAPLPGEENSPEACAQKGHWQYSFLQRFVPQGSKEDFLFDAQRTKALASLFASHPEIGKIFIEPHLKTRLQLTSEKICFHGCGAVRHDDHIHVQLR